MNKGKKMATECDKGRIRKQQEDKRDENTRIRERETQAPRNMYGLIEHLTIETKCPISERTNPGSSESDLMSVCVKRRARAYKQCAQNNNKITANIR